MPHRFQDKNHRLSHFQDDVDVECPGCGTQRSLAHLSQGEFYEAFIIYPAIYTLIPFFIVLALHFTNKSRNYNKAIIVLAILNGIVIIGSYLFKIFNQTN